MKAFFAILFVLCIVLLGLYLAFSASVLLGFAVLIVEPAPLVIGIASIFWGVDLAQRILAELSAFS